MKEHMFGEGGEAFFLIKNSKLKTLVIHCSLGKEDANIKVINCNRGKTISNFEIYNMDGEKKEIIINVETDNFLINVICDKCLIPCFEYGTNDYRRLALNISDIEIVEGDLYKIFKEIEVDKNQSIFNLYNYEFNNVHDVDYLFLQNFESVISTEEYFLDIGANIGQSASSIANVSETIKIMSFEPNKLLRNNIELVQKIIGERMEFNMYGVGEYESDQAFYVPYAEGEYFTQEGSFIKEELQNDLALHRIGEYLKDRSSRIIIKEFSFEIKSLNSKEIKSYFIKIDTQGFELSSIKGIKKIIRKSQPIIMMEKNENISEILKYLSNYRVFYYDHKKNKFVVENTESYNAFLLCADYTKSKKINAILRLMIDNL